jgi:hypothetical protein
MGLRYIKFATFPANGKPGHSALTNNGMGFALSWNNFKNIFFSKAGASDKLKKTCCDPSLGLDLSMYVCQQISHPPHHPVPLNYPGLYANRIEKIWVTDKENKDKGLHAKRIIKKWVTRESCASLTQVKSCNFVRVFA